MKKDQARKPPAWLFNAEPDLVRFLDRHKHTIFQHRVELENIVVPAADQDGLRKLGETITALFPRQVLTELAPAACLAELRAYFSISYIPQPLSIDELTWFQLAIHILRLASDYISGCELLDAHREGFARAYPRVLAFNAITGAVSWSKIREQMKGVLEDSFPERYGEMLQNSRFFRDSRLANEALIIGMMLVDKNGTDAPSEAGVMFERECEGILQTAGFTVERTPASSDFGVDLLAKKNGISYAIQCKCHKVPVGVSGIQEVVAGRQHYFADAAVVVSNSGFTAQAKRLAESNSVLLINGPLLTRIDDLFANII